MNDFERRTLRKIHWTLGIFIAGLVLSGVTAFPLQLELDWLINGADWTAAQSQRLLSTDGFSRCATA